MTMGAAAKLSSVVQKTSQTHTFIRYVRHASWQYKRATRQQNGSSNLKLKLDFLVFLRGIQYMRYKGSLYIR